MTKEERAKRWFRRIPNNEAIALEKKMEICARVARKIVFRGVLLVCARWGRVFK